MRLSVVFCVVLLAICCGTSDAEPSWPFKYIIYPVGGVGKSFLETLCFFFVGRPTCWGNGGAAKPSFVQGLKPTQLTEGQAGRLEAKVNLNSDGSVPDVEWLKDGKPLTEGDGIKFITKPDGTVALEIANVTPDDAGTYTLRVMNPDGGSTDSSATATVTPAGVENPTFGQELTINPTQLTEGQPGRLEAKLNPNKDGAIPDVEWLKDGQPLTEGDNIKFIENDDGTVALEIANVTPDDAGEYTLRAKNPDGGSADSSATVTVIPADGACILPPEECPTTQSSGGTGGNGGNGDPECLLPHVECATDFNPGPVTIG